MNESEIVEYFIAYVNNIPTPLYDYEREEEALVEILRNISFENIQLILHNLANNDYSEYIFNADLWRGKIFDIFAIWVERDPEKFYNIATPYFMITRNELGLSKK